MTTNTQPRAATFLIDNHIPYSEMTEEEVDSVIEWRAARKAESAEVKARQAAFEKSQAEIIERLDAQQKRAKTDFEEIVGRIAARALAVEEVNRLYE